GDHRARRIDPAIQPGRSVHNPCPGGQGRESGGRGMMAEINWPGVWAIFHHEMMRFFRTIWQSLASPVVSTVLYFVVFGAAIGGRIQSVEGVPYGAFIVPGLMMLTVLQQSVSNASFGIYFPKFSGTIYEYLVSPVG